MQPTSPLRNVVLGDQVGEGAFGRVFQGRHVALDIDVAVKIVEGPAPELDRAAAEAPRASLIRGF